MEKKNAPAWEFERCLEPFDGIELRGEERRKGREGEKRRDESDEAR